MSHIITVPGTVDSEFFVEGETKSLYVKTPRGNMVCIDSEGGVPRGAVVERPTEGFSPVPVGAIIQIRV